MPIDDRVLELFAEYAGVDPQTMTIDDLIRQEEGGWLSEEDIAGFFDELEGEFGIDINLRDPEGLDTLENIIAFVKQRMESTSDPADTM